MGVPSRFLLARGLVEATKGLLLQQTNSYVQDPLPSALQDLFNSPEAGLKAWGRTGCGPWDPLC